MTRIIVIAVIILAFFLLLRFLISRNSVKGNLSSRSYKTIMAIIIIAIAATILYTILKSTAVYIDKNGKEQYPEKVVSALEVFFPGSEVKISIHLDAVTIGNRTYHDLDSVKNEILKNVENDCTYVVIDDYALTDTYHAVKNLLTECGVAESSIRYEEVE